MFFKFTKLQTFIVLETYFEFDVVKKYLNLLFVLQLCLSINIFVIFILFLCPTLQLILLNLRNNIL